jgi:DNA-binding transcriptional MerR regulator
MKSYSTAEVAELLGLSPKQVRGFVADRLLRPERGPRGAFRFSFQDLVLLRAAAGLRAAHIPTRRIRRSLRTLAAQLPHGRPLSEVRIAADGERVVVSDGGAPWHPESGQYHIDFQVAELAGRVAPLAGRAARQARLTGLTADDWVALAVDMEAYAPGEAKEAYRCALEVDSRHVDALVNLGRLLHEEGLADDAESLYRRALDAQPQHATAAYNLGVSLEDQNRAREAVSYYELAIGSDPALADAYFNLARIYEQLGDTVAAVRNLKSYRTLTAG